MIGRIAVLALALGITTVGAAATPVQGKGFTCTAANGNVRRINIDLQKKRWHEAGDSAHKIQRVEDAKITLRHYSTITDGFYLDYALDRSTLILTSTTASGEGMNTNQWQCVIGEPFDFASERQF